MTEVDDLVMISALEHWSYCPRQCGLIHLEQVWDENVFTIRGDRIHERADEPIVRLERGRRVVRALPIWNRAIGLTGRADVVEFGPDGQPYPVEYKSGKTNRSPHAAIQLCAQALCLEEMFDRPVPEGAIYYVASKKREPVAFDEVLRAKTISTAKAIQQMRAEGGLPKARFDQRCRHCSLIDACMPQMLVKAAESRSPTFRPLPEVQIP
jgi:CRISPR-associated exonuclease Cas4